MTSALRLAAVRPALARAAPRRSLLRRLTVAPRRRSAPGREPALVLFDGAGTELYRRAVEHMSARSLAELLQLFGFARTEAALPVATSSEQGASEAGAGISARASGAVAAARAWVASPEAAAALARERKKQEAGGTGGELAAARGARARKRAEARAAAEAVVRQAEEAAAAEAAERAAAAAAEAAARIPPPPSPPPKSPPPPPAPKSPPPPAKLPEPKPAAQQAQQATPKAEPKPQQQQQAQQPQALPAAASGGAVAGDGGKGVKDALYIPSLFSKTGSVDRAGNANDGKTQALAQHTLGEGEGRRRSSVRRALLADPRRA